MRVATVRSNGGTSVVRIDGETAVFLPFRDVRALLESGSDWRERAADATGDVLAADRLDFAPLVPKPDKIVCVGLNYRTHADEANLELPEYPMLFAKYSGSLIGAHDDIRLPWNSQEVDWEAELCVVIGSSLRHGDEPAAVDAMAGYTVANDISMRDWQQRTGQFLQGKTFETSTPVGPQLVTLDELRDPGDLELTCEVDGERMQSARTSDMIFSPAEIVAYLSQVITLVPGDLILSGTTSGIGVAMDPPRFLAPGSVVKTTLEGVGVLENHCVPEAKEESP